MMVVGESLGTFIPRRSLICGSCLPVNILFEHPKLSFLCPCPTKNLCTGQEREILAKGGYLHLLIKTLK